MDSHIFTSTSKRIALILILAGLISPLSVLLGNFMPTSYSFGALHTTDVVSFSGLTILFISISKLIVGFGILGDKPWAIKIGYLDALVSMFIYLFFSVEQFVTIDPLANRKITFEILFLIPYLIWMARMYHGHSKKTLSALKGS
ncbi:hypothetical protein [Pedobacter ghigonis]|uniref:hypothetical protein n=1 Tax=Pedobacter ghigonis TaxID=2730403 RepID=UPI00158B594E|nr:hypothetical protein [Pedobacter ghigonis]